MRAAPTHRSRAWRPITALLALGLLLGLVPTVAGASSWTFGTPIADSTFDKGIVFSQPITIDKPIGRVEILLTFPDAVGPTVFVLPGRLSAYWIDVATAVSVFSIATSFPTDAP